MRYYPVNKGNTTFRGDTGKFRAALHALGLKHDAIMFNTKSSDGKRRRIKLWFADDVFNSSQATQHELEKKLREAYGTRILSMYFIKRPNWCGGGKCMCIRLQN